MAKVLVEEVDLGETESRKEWQCPKCGATIIDVNPPAAGADCPICVAVKAGKYSPSALYPIGKEMGVRVAVVDKNNG